MYLHLNYADRKHNLKFNKTHITAIVRTGDRHINILLITSVIGQLCLLLYYPSTST